jgi:hypothetical protein
MPRQHLTLSARMWDATKGISMAATGRLIKVYAAGSA